MIASVFRLSTLLLGVAFLLTGHGLQLALIPLRAELMGWSNLSIGILGSVYFCGFLLGCFSVPGLVKRIGHIRCFATLTALITATVLVLGLFNAFPIWIVLRFLTGVAATNVN